jgi:hypothetical protein
MGIDWRISSQAFSLPVEDVVHRSRDTEVEIGQELANRGKFVTTARSGIFDSWSLDSGLWTWPGGTRAASHGILGRRGIHFPCFLLNPAAIF